MALMMGSLYDVLRSANVDEDRARKASEEAPGYENRLAKIEADLMMIKWMGGVLVAGVAALVLKAFF